MNYSKQSVKSSDKQRLPYKCFFKIEMSMRYTLFMYKSVRSQRHAEEQNDIHIKFLMSLEHNNNIFNNKHASKPRYWRDNISSMNNPWQLVPILSYQYPIEKAQFLISRPFTDSCLSFDNTLQCKHVRDSENQGMSWFLWLRNSTLAYYALY